MKKILLLLLAATLVLTACKKKVDEVEFVGTVVDGCECTGYGSMSINDMDWGWIVQVASPDSLGGSYTDPDGVVHRNAIILYGTHSRLGIGSTISGELYLDDQYANSYCSYRPNYGIPQAVCTRLD